MDYMGGGHNRHRQNHCRTKSCLTKIYPSITRDLQYVCKYTYMCGFFIIYIYIYIYQATYSDTILYVTICILLLIFHTICCENIISVNILYRAYLKNVLHLTENRIHSASFRN